MTTFAQTDAASPVADFVESSDIAQLQNQLAVALSRLTDQSLLVTSLTLCGAGDGSSFGVLVEAAAPEDIIDGTGIDPATLSPVLYVAGSPGALLKERKAAVGAAPDGFPNVVDVQIDGASKGKRFAGMALFASSGVSAFGEKFDFLVAGNETYTQFVPYSAPFDTDIAVQCKPPTSVSSAGSGGFVQNNSNFIEARLQGAPKRDCAVFGQLTVKNNEDAPLELEIHVTRTISLNIVSLTGISPQRMVLPPDGQPLSISVSGVGEVTRGETVSLRMKNKTAALPDPTVDVLSAEVLIQSR